MSLITLVYIDASFLILEILNETISTSILQITSNQMFSNIKEHKIS